ncbi:MAG: M48 family metalloprotease [Treponema sp.]|jgi:hypothetical protein|nr:M48 family metalloprotease [Treponema sp.]
MKKCAFFLAAALSAAAPLSGQTGQTMYVAVKSAPLKTSTWFFAGTAAELRLGDAVTIVQPKGAWYQVRTADKSAEGWVSQSSLTSKKILPSSGRTVDAAELALAGKGFSADVESTYKQASNVTFEAVDAIEKVEVPPEELLAFITQGGLAGGSPEGNAVPTAPPSYADKGTVPEDEYFLGRSVAARILQTYTPYTENAELLLYVNKICQSIVINSPVPSLFNGYHVYLLKSDQINAFATPGGHIFLTTALVRSAQSEDALAAVIAHEIAHIQMHHALSLLKDTETMRDLSKAATRASGYASKAAGLSDKNAVFRQTVNDMASALMVSGYAQPQEYEADAKAVTLLKAAGYDPAGIIDILNILVKTQANHPGGFNTTHPKPQQRLSRVQNSARNFRSGKDTRALREARYTEVFAKE